MVTSVVEGFALFAGRERGVELFRGPQEGGLKFFSEINYHSLTWHYFAHSEMISGVEGNFGRQTPVGPSGK